MGNSCNGFLQSRQALGIRKSNMVARLKATEIQTRRDSDMFYLKKVLAERECITTKGADVCVKVKRPLRLDGNTET
jgi:hypothetical protein